MTTPPPATTRNMATTAAEIRTCVDLTEQAKKENLLWFASYKDIPKLDERLKTFSSWELAIKTACEKQNCLDILENAPQTNDKLAINNCKNVNLLIAHSIDEDLKIYVLKKSATGSYQSIYKLRPKPKEQRVNILAKVPKIDSTDIEDYVRQMQRVQGQLMRLDPERAHHESKAPAHMTRLLDNLNEQQMEKSRSYE